MGKGGTKGKPDNGNGNGGPDGSGGDRIVIFGDSLSDNGLFGELASAFLTTPVPFQTPQTDYSQSFTNGQVYAETWVGLAGYAPENVLNLALAGAEATGTRLVQEYIVEYSTLRATNGDLFSIVTDPGPRIIDAASPYDGEYLADWNINLAGQVDRYLQYFVDDPQANTTASIFIGANDLSKFEFDVFDFLFGNQIGDFARDIADSIEGAARDLAAGGVDDVILFTMPTANLFFAWEDADSIERSVATDLLDATSDAILSAAQDLNGSGIATDVVRIDLLSYELNYDPNTFGFGTVEPVLLGYGGDPDWVETAAGSGIYEPVFRVNPGAGVWRDDQRLFYDEIHPTEALHDVLGVFAHESTTSSVSFGSNGNNRLRTGGADDLSLGRDGNDILILRGGNDVALGGRGRDRIEGAGGSDLLIGGREDDTILGGEMSDVLVGGRGADHMDGGAGNDILIGGTENDTMLGGVGEDHFIFIEDVLTTAVDANGATIDGEGGADTLWLVLSDATLAALGTDGSAADLASLNLAVSNVESVEVLAYDALDTLAFAGDLDDRYAEAQLWGVV